MDKLFQFLIIYLGHFDGQYWFAHLKVDGKNIAFLRFKYFSRHAHKMEWLFGI